MSKTTKGVDEPLKHPDHRRPRTRREFIAQGFSHGLGSVIGCSGLAGLLHSSKARAALSPEMVERLNECNVTGGNRKIPFICFDLAGGANMVGSNVLAGGQGGQLDFLSTAGYSRQGLPGDMLPSADNNVDTTLGLAFHSDSAFLRGILEKFTSTDARARMNGTVIPARSENDTASNPHNPMYAINLAGAKGELLSLIGSRGSESGGNSVSPGQFVNAEVRPTKIDRRTDVLGLVKVGDFGRTLTHAQVVAVMESVSRGSDLKIDRMAQQLGLADTDPIKEKLKCTYVNNANLAFAYPDIDILDIEQDPDIYGQAESIFAEGELNDREFAKTASVMKLALDSPNGLYPYAGAGTITMGGYDYHDSTRTTGEARDARAGRCMGACLEYAARKGRPLMIYVCSDGSVSSNGQTDSTGKGVWTTDNQQTGASFFLVYNPGGKPELTSPGRNQLGYMTSGGNVETTSSPAANSVSQLVQMVMLNYMALHGDQGHFTDLFSENGLIQGLGNNAATLDQYIAFAPITTEVDSEGKGVISNT